MTRYKHQNLAKEFSKTSSVAIRKYREVVERMEANLMSAMEADGVTKYSYYVEGPVSPIKTEYKVVVWIGATAMVECGYRVWVKDYDTECRQADRNTPFTITYRTSRLLGRKREIDFENIDLAIGYAICHGIKRSMQ